MDEPEFSADEKKFRGWRLLGALFIVIAILAATSFVVDWKVIGPLEGRMW
jgi:hypothetical protein